MAYYYNREFLDECLGSGVASTNKMFKQKETIVKVGEDKLHDSICMILSTRVGERFFMPEFGSRLHDAIFEQNDLIFKDLVDMYVREALGIWEKRISVVSVDVGIESEGNIVPVTITYRITNSSMIGTYVYPFNVKDNGDTEVYDIGSNQY